MRLPAPLTFAINSVGIAANTLTLAPVLFATAAVKSVPAFKQQGNKWAEQIAEFWINNNISLIQATTGITVDVQSMPDLDRYGSYLVNSNHQSWTDIFVLQTVFNRKIPTFRFFLKQELIWVPVIGVCWWALDFPFMKRYTKEQLAKNPSLKGKDKQTTIDRCKKFANSPVSIMNFFEGTRFTPSKHQQQQSPYRHLLKPKAGGASYALNILSKSLDTLIDTTIIYPEGKSTFTEYLSGKTPRIIVNVQKYPIPLELREGDYENDAEFRTQFQTWVSDLWAKKDQEMDTLLKQN